MVARLTANALTRQWHTWQQGDESGFRNGWQRLRGSGERDVALAKRFVGGGDGCCGVALANLVFPPSCVSCEAELDEAAIGERRAALRRRASSEMELFDGPMCERCGAPVPACDGLTNGDGLPPVRKVAGCYRCRGRKMWFDATIALGLYDGRLREMLLRMKTPKGDALSLAMGRLIWQMRGERLAALEVDVVAPIPLHWRRRVAHRTNSAAVLAEVLAAKLRVPLAEGLLRRLASYAQAIRPESHRTVG